MAVVASPIALRIAMNVIVRAAPARATTVPASGSAISDPAAIDSSSSPRLPGLSSRPSRTCGMRDAQLAKMKPAPKKT